MSFFIDLVDKNNRTKEIKKYINAESVIDFSKDLPSKNFNKPKINDNLTTLKRLI